MKDKKNFCEKLTFRGTVLSVLFHFVCCGLPALLGLLSAVLGVSLSLPWVGSIKPEYMIGLMIVAGVLLVMSFVFYFKKTKCCDNASQMKWNKIVLIIAFVLYIMGIVVNFVTPMAGHEISCH